MGDEKKTLYYAARLYTTNGIVMNGRMLVNELGKLEAVGGPEILAPDGALSRL